MSIKHSSRSGVIIGIFFFIFLNIKECCGFSLESPHHGNSNEYSQHTIINIKKKKIILNFISNLIMSAATGFPKNSKDASSESIPVTVTVELQWLDGLFTTAVSNSFFTP